MVKVGIVGTIVHEVSHPVLILVGLASLLGTDVADSVQIKVELIPVGNVWTVVAVVTNLVLVLM